MNVVERAQLVWRARAEASRLHRLAVAASRSLTPRSRNLDVLDSLAHRCRGCGDWRYGNAANAGKPGTYRRCPACGTRDRTVVPGAA